MAILTRKSELKLILEDLFQEYEKRGITSFIDQFNKQLLQKKVKFPLLEYAATSVHTYFDENLHISICDEIETLRTIGGNVIIAILLKERLPYHLDESFAKAVEFIAQGEEWYVSDIIGERVFGNGILQFPALAIPQLQRMSIHESQWVVRSIGAGSHLATKRGLEKPVAQEVFQLLLQLGGSTNYQIRRGIGWAAKTMAKFHPDVIEQNQLQIQDEKIGNWFRKKVNIGLERHQHAQSN